VSEIVRVWLPLLGVILADESVCRNDVDSSCLRMYYESEYMFASFIKFTYALLTKSCWAPLSR
jgi:hypothetical protein